MPLYMLNQLEVQYLHDYAGIRTRIGLTANPIVNFSGVLGSNVIALGTDVSFDTKTGEFTKCNGLSFSNADLIASLTLLQITLPVDVELGLDRLDINNISDRCFKKPHETQ
ncbi:mitochondrial outer membrane protein porin of 34 kDa-like isoform X2 [Camellia sinensis]|uniref:mitochondrial outer membrane protein porin of 34 kDa-like isoform X2 n=1 Tax=Camellia sinensis TaxID=4442 RepID=UPI0010357573|nr:mitochondrial outer membrane protein porin of 34 kDa-like isoform X2 [Camellia sinensis]